MTTVRVLGLVAAVLAGCKGDATTDSAGSAAAPKLVETVGELELVQTGDAYSVRSKDHLMTAPFPGRPKLTIQNMTGAAGPVAMTMAIYEGKGGDTAYGAISMRVLAPPDGHSFDVERIYNAARDGAKRAMKGEVSADGPFDISGVRGRHFTLEFAQSGVDLEQQQWTVYVPWQNMTHTFSVTSRAGDHSFDADAAKLVAGVVLSHGDAGSGTGGSAGSAGSASGSAARADAERWMWLDSAGGTYLAYYYMDRTMGPSAKGDVVGDPPTAAELTAATAHPRHTFRDPLNNGARLITPAEHAKLALPARPPWLDTFEPAGSPPIDPPLTRDHGRPHSSNVVIQRACGRSAGSFWLVATGKALPIGSARSTNPGEYALIDDAGVLPKHATIDNAPTGITITPEPGATVTVDDKPITAPTKLALNVHIGIGKTTLIVRPPSFQPPRSGIDPTCPGFDDILWIEDACSMYGTSSAQLVGGFDMIVGTDMPARLGLPKGYGSKTPTRVKLLNDHKTVKFTTETPKRLPKLKGKSLAKGNLHIGDQLTVGDRIFVVTGPNEEHAVTNTPLPTCPEAKAKKQKKK